MPEKSRESLTNPNVLITGATGFLGKYAVDEFIRSGYPVVATGRNEQRLQSLEQAGVKTVPASLEALADMKLDVDTVVHTAALSSPWGNWQKFYEHNVVGTRHVIDFCAANDVRRLVYVSSPSIYSGKGDRFGIKEEDYDKSNKLNNYIRSKIATEEILQKAHAATTIPELAIIRPRGLIGVGDTSLIPRLLKANDRLGIPLFNEGRNMVDVTCVENVALALRLAVEAKRAEGDVYNITNGEPRIFKSILDDFFEGIGEKPKYLRANRSVMYAAAGLVEAAYKSVRVESEPPLTRYAVCTVGYSQTLDISKARTELVYEPALSLDEGIQKFAEDYREKHG